MSASLKALARSRAWALLGRLYLRGVSAEDSTVLSQLPALATHLELPYDAESAAATHYHLFAFNLFPYASSFLSVDGLLGGELTESLQRRYQRTGMEVATQDVAADHIGLMLDYLARLAMEEAHATGAWVAPVRRQQTEFVSADLLPWFPPFLLALRRQSAPLYQAIGELTLELALAEAEGAPLPAPLLPALGDPLAYERSGLREIARFFSLPAQCGLFLSRDTIAELARSLELPRGFGNRAAMIETMLRAAVHFDTLPTLLDRLQQTWTDEIESHVILMSTYPAVAPVAIEWKERLAHGRQVLDRLAQGNREALET